MKNKSNLAIILIVILASLTVIIIVIAAGLLKSGDSQSGASSAPPIVISSADESASEPQSEPFSEPELSSAPPESSAAEESSQPFENDIGQNISEFAKGLLGVPFAVNGDSPSGFDNSGFIYYVLRQNGYITCPRTTAAQSEMGTKTPHNALKPGDLVFFSGEDSDEVSFGGIYTGDGKMIACLMPGTNVKEIDITTDYYTANFFCGISLS